MTKTANHWQLVQKLFDEIAHLSPEQQQIRLAEAAETHPDIHADLINILHSDAEMADHTLQKAQTVLNDITEQPALGTQIGPFKLISELGSGGMGTVYLAERTDGQIKQQVAIKFAHTALVDKNARARFENEQQVLASLEHPGIARLIDVGLTDSGLPYYVMEHITGIPVDEYCRQNNLSVGQKIAIFQQICDAVSYAHRRLVIHRDLKPANILVNNDGQVKLLDFGIAKLLTPNTADLRQTRTMGLFLSPQYAAPEQFLGQAVSFATDVYGLGIVLYELIGGELPYDLSGLTLGQMERKVLREMPCSFKGSRDYPDLNAICLHCLKKEPEERYRSVDDLIDDLKRYLNHEPVQARKPTQLYKIGKFLRRNRALTAVTTILAISVISFVILSKFQRDVAVEREQEANAVTDFLVTILRDSDPYQTGNPDITVKELLDRGKDKVQQSLEGKHTVRGRIEVALARAYVAISAWDDALELVEQSIESFEEEDRDRRNLIDALNIRAYILNVLGKYKGADQSASLALKLSKENAADDLVEKSLIRKSWALFQLGERQEALLIDIQRLGIVEQLYGVDSIEVADAKSDLGDRYRLLGKNETALKYLDQAIGILEIGDEELKLARAYGQRARVYRSLSIFDKAITDYHSALDVFRRALGENHVEVAWILNSIAVLKVKMGLFEEASSLYQKSLHIHKSQATVNGRYLAQVHFNLAKNFHHKIGDVDSAIKHYDAAISASDSIDVEGNDWVAMIYLGRAALLNDKFPHSNEVDKELHSVGEFLNRRQIAQPVYHAQLNSLRGYRRFVEGFRDQGAQMMKESFDTLTDEYGPEDDWTIEAKQRLELASGYGKINEQLRND